MNKKIRRKPLLANAIYGLGSGVIGYVQEHTANLDADAENQKKKKLINYL